MPDARELNFGNIPRTDQPRKLNFGSIPFMEPESPYDDSALGAAKRIGGSLVEYGAALPTGLQTTISAVNQLIGRPIRRLAGAFDPELEKGLRASEAQGFETARKIRESAKQFSEKTLGAKPGTPITIENLKKESLGGKIGMLARGTAESVPVTLVNLGMTLLNPAVGTASIYLAETGGTRADLEELEKSGVKIDPAYKDIAAVGGGALKTALEKTGLESLVSKAPGVRSKVFNVLSSLLTEFRTEGVQELSDVLVEAGAKVSGNDSLKVFETFKTEIENNLPRLEEASIRGGLAGGAIRGGVEISRIPSERSVARQKQATEEESRAQEESRQAEEARSTREKLQVASERESLIDRLQKERDLEIGGPLIGVNEKGVRPIKTIDAELAQTTDSEVVRALQFERELAVERRAGEKRTPASPFVTGRKEGSEREYIISERKAGKKLSEVNAEIANRYQTFDEFMGDLPTGSRVLKNKRVFEKVGDKDWALVESGRVSPEKKIEERRLTDADIIKSFEPATIATPEAAAPPRPFSEELDRIIQPLQDEQAFRDFEREQGRAELSRAQDEMRRMSEPFITPEPDDVEVIPPVPKTRALPTGEIAPERRAIPPFTKRREFRVSEYGEAVAITSPEELQRAQALRNQAQAERMSQTAPTREVTGARFDLSDFKPAERTPERPATPIAKESVTPKPAVRLREIQEQFAAESGKTFDQLLPGQKAAATKKARAILFEELREAQKPKVEKPVVPTSEREIRAQTPAPPEANAKSFNTALDDFLKIEKETKGKPLSEQMTVAKQRLEEKGYHPAIVDELANPERLKRPDLEGDLVEATTREGRIKRAVEPPPELKPRVDNVAKRTKQFRDAEADYLQARKDIFGEIEKLGGKIIAQGEDGTFKIEIKPGKAKLSLQDQLALAKLRQEAAEAGAYSLATVGKGFEIAAAPLRIKSGETLKGDLNQKVSEFISRKNAFQDAKKGADAAKKALVDSYTDFYFKNKVEGKPNASLIGRVDDIPVEVQLRRKASSSVPDTAVIDPTTGKTWAERLRDERKEAQKRSEALGPQGEPYVETRKVGVVRAEAEKATGTSFFDIRGNLAEADRAAWDAVQKRAGERLTKVQGRVDAGLLDAGAWKDLAETGYYVSKALGRASKGKAVEFAEWANQMVKQFGEKIRPILQDLWNDIKGGFEPEKKPVFYSHTAKVLESKLPNSAPAAQMKNVVEAFVKKGEIPKEEAEWSGLLEWLDKKEGKVTKQEVAEFLRENQIELREVEGGDKFESYQLPGGENYKEILLTIPEEKRYYSLDEVAHEMFGTDFNALNANDRGEVTLARINKNKVSNVFVGSHFDEPNILAHVRLNERTGKNGERILFLEEIQSDWHQQGRARGYVKKPTVITKENLEIVKEGEDYFDFSVKTKDGKHRLLVNSSKDRAKSFIESFSETSVEHDNFNAVADAPFKSSWHELAFKRMLRYAVDNGFDKIAWTTGEQQAARYNLTKQVDAIRISKSPEGYRVQAKKDGAKVVDQGGLSKQKLADTIGKDLAKKAVADLFQKNAAVYRGDDLKVGGEGMRDFYDKIVPEFVNSYTKKWGGKSETNEVSVDTPRIYKEWKGELPSEPQFEVAVAELKRSSDGHDAYTGLLLEQRYRQTQDVMRTLSSMSQQGAQTERLLTKLFKGSFVEKRVSSVYEKAHVLDITPEMTAGVAKGQPLFGRAKLFDVTRNLSESEVSALNASKERLDIASREFAGKLYSGPAFSPQIWKEYVEIGHYVAKGLARNLGEKAKITFENFKETFKNAVGPDLFKRLESHLATLWDQVKALPDNWKAGDEVPSPVRAEAVENTPDAKDAPRAYEKKERQFNFGLPLLDRLERSNRVGVQMAQAWKKAHGILKTTLGKYAVEIRNVAKEAGVRRDQTTPHLDVIAAGDEKRGRNLLLVELINNPEKRNNYPLTETEKKILSLYDKMATEFDAKISKLIGKEPSGKPKFSPTLNNEAREALFVLKGGPLFEAIAKAVANRSGIELNKVKQKLASGNLSGLDIPTHVNLKGNLVAIGSADAISALQALNFEHARALGLLRTFGPKWKNRLKEIREVYDRQDGDLETFDLIEQAYRGLRPKDWASEKQASRNLAYRLLFRAADPILTSLALSKSAYMQITQPFIDLQNVGVKNFVKTYRELFGGKIKADDLERMGLISRDLLNWKFAEGEKLEDYSRMISALVNRGDLMHAVSLLNDVVAATHWRNYVNSLIGKKLGAEERQTLKVNLGLTDAEIKKVEQGKFQDPLGENPSTPEEEFFVEMVRRGKTQSQHTGKFGGEKSKFQTGSTAPFFLKFQNYTIGEFQRWRRETENVAKALKEGDEGERNAAIMRMLKLVGITSLQGELINIIRHTIKGEWDEADESSAVAQLAKENYAQAAKNFLWNFAEAGFMGAFTRAYLAYNIAQGSAGALLDLTLPTNIIHELWDMAGRRGKYADKTTGERIERFLETRVPASDLPRAGKRALALMGLAKEDGHKTDVATRAYFKWLEDTGRQKDFPEKEGYVESRRNFLLAYRALNSGDDEEVMPLLIKGFDAKILENERMTPKEALGRLKASLGARMRVLKKDKGRLVSRFDKKTTEDLKKEIGEEKYDLLVAHDTRLNRLLESLYVTNKHLVRRK